VIEAAREHVEACGVRVRVRIRVRVRVSASASTPLAPVVHHTASATYREVSTCACAPRTCASRASRSRTCRSGHVRVVRVRAGGRHAWVGRTYSTEAAPGHLAHGRPGPEVRVSMG
jgi:hypothetical protein